MEKGTKLGKMEILSVRSGGGKGKHRIFKCKCDCGKVKNIKSHNFKKGKYCSCLKHLYNDLTGEIYGKIKVQKLLQRDKEFDKKRGHLYLCKCVKCGQEKQYHTSTIKRKGFKGCRCPKDLTLSSKKSWYKTYKDNAKKRNLTFNLTFDEFINICEQPCHYTGIKQSILINKHDLFGSWACNGVDRLDSSKGYTKDNVVPCSKDVNKMKGSLGHYEFLAICNLITQYNGTQRIKI